MNLRKLYQVYVKKHQKFSFTKFARALREEDAMENIKDAIMGCLEALNQRAMVRDVTERIVEVALA
jgi:hypothetical protein